ncbi:leucine-rich repeat domain-containing protein [Sporobolomyces koalae]|uniref:leucine-rich repeat domain-containing protein n=1 Tax=Sporobolomyces koalae TaxID=500713 RepID=UPI00317A3348
MADPQTPQRSRIGGLDRTDQCSSESPSRARPALARVAKPSASASPQIKAALAALRKQRQQSDSPSFNTSALASPAAEPDPFSTPPRTRASRAPSASSNGLDGRPDETVLDDTDVSWAKKNETRLIEVAKKTGLLNFASQGLDRLTPSVYSILLPKDSPYHPYRRYRSTYGPEPESSFSFARDDSETAWFEQVGLKSLNLANNELSKLDDEVGGFEELEFLDLHGNLLPSIPASIGFLVNLTSLNLASNAMTDFPLQIVNLRYLRELNLSYNKLHNLWTSTWKEELADFLKPLIPSPTATPESPERVRDFFNSSPSRQSQPEITSATNAPFPLLQSLNLSGNSFDAATFISNGFEFPPELKQLAISDCLLTDVALPPLPIGKLAHLQELDLAGNEFTNDFFDSDLFPTGPDPLFASLRSLDVSRNPIEQLAALEDFLVDSVGAPIEYVGLAKPIHNLVKSEEQRLRSGRRIGLRMDDVAQVNDRPELEVIVRDCPLSSEQDRRRSKFPGYERTRSVSADARSDNKVCSTPSSVSASPSSVPATSNVSSTVQDASTAIATPTRRRQVVLEPWEEEAAAGLSTPAGRRKAAAQAARERADRLRQEEAEKARLKDEGRRRKQLELEERQAKEVNELEQNLSEAKIEDDHRTVDRSTRSPSPPPYSPREASPCSPGPIMTTEKAMPTNASADPASAILVAALNPSTRTIDLSARSLTSLPSRTEGFVPTLVSAPLALDLSRNLLPTLTFSAFETWGWLSSLRSLNLSRNRIGSFEAAPISLTLPALAHLDLSYNHLISCPPQPQEASLSQLCRRFPSLRSLDLSHNRLTSLEGIETLVFESPQLRTLSLQGNKISDITALCRLAESIESNERGERERWHLEQLDLSDNEIARVSCPFQLVLEKYAC